MEKKEKKHDYICDQCYLLMSAAHICVVCNEKKLCSRNGTLISEDKCEGHRGRRRSRDHQSGDTSRDRT